MNRLVIWKVQGYLRKEGESRYSSKRDFREALLAVASNLTAEDVMSVAGDALLHNWSAHPHWAEVTFLAKVKGDSGNDQMGVIAL